MSARPVSELLYDSEAALRLVDSAIEASTRNAQARQGVADEIFQKKDGR